MNHDDPGQLYDMPLECHFVTYVCSVHICRNLYAKGRRNLLKGLSCPKSFYKCPVFKNKMYCKTNTKCRHIQDN